MSSVTPSAIKGTLAAPASKSMTVRAMAAALLASGESGIRNVSYCDDGIAAMRIATDLGAVLSERKGEVIVRSPGIRGAESARDLIDCGESGLSMRMFAPIVALLPRETILEASGSLARRPMEMVCALGQLGVLCRTTDGHAPVTVRGPMTGGRIEIDAATSSQFLTGLLMALPLCEKDSQILVSGLKSTPYVRMTLELLEHFGIVVDHDEDLSGFRIGGSQSYGPMVYTVEGDWSGAAFLLVAGALAGEVTVTGLDTRSLQADRAILEALRRAGADLTLEGDRVSARKANLRAFTFDATDCPDLFPPLVALASKCDGTSTIYGAERLTHKESDRAAALGEEFGKMGVRVETSGNRMEVQGGHVHAARVTSHNDHRIAMACAVAALVSNGEVQIEGSGCVAKSYPAFFADIDRLRERDE